VETQGRIGWIVFDHPERRNAISVDMWSAMPQAVQELAGDDEVHVVVLRGAGETAFVSGADISEFESRRTGSAAADYDLASVRAVGALLQLEKPLLAMIHGFCLGGGVAVSLAADLRYAADDAVFAIPAARLGVALRMGLVNQVAPKAELEGLVCETAERIAGNAPLTLRSVKQIVGELAKEPAARDHAKVAAGIRACLESEATRPSASPATLRSPCAA